MPKIIITFDGEGGCEVDVQGAVGKQCDKLAEPYEKLLGRQTDRKNKPEYVRATATAARVEAGR